MCNKVLLQAIAVRKTLITLRACKRLLTGVHSHMSAQVRFLRESLAASHARGDYLTSVHAHVLLEGCTETKRSSAHRTREGLLCTKLINKILK